MVKNLKKMDVVSLIEELHKQFIYGNQNIYENSIFANELLKRDTQTLINYIGNYLKGVYEKVRILPYQDQMEVQQAWIKFFCKIVKEKKINMTSVVVNFDQWMEWAINYG